MERLSKRDLRGYRTIYVDGAFGSRLEDWGAQKIGYNNGAFGWNWSALKLADVVVVHGYRHFPKCNYYLSKEEVAELSAKAEKLAVNKRIEFIANELSKLVA